jgi:hypothetical protein
VTHGIFRRPPANSAENERLEVHADAQSLSFYCDIAGYLAERLDGWATLDLLDVGPRTGAGLALLRLMHHPLSFSRIKLDPVTGIDTDPRFKEVAERLYPDIEALHGDAFHLAGRTWDVVMSSHTIEHVDDPTTFLRKLEGLARRLVIVACPFEEENLIVWHKQRISWSLLNDLGYEHLKVYRSNHWHNGLCCIASRWVGTQPARAMPSAGNAIDAVKLFKAPMSVGPKQIAARDVETAPHLEGNASIGDSLITLRSDSTQRKEGRRRCYQGKMLALRIDLY